MTDSLHETLGAVAALPGVRAAVVATDPDGLAAASVAAVDVDIDALAAFAAALFHRTRLANRAAGYGRTQQLVLDAEHGRLFVAAHGDVAFVVLTEREAGAGLIRVALQRAVRAMA
jgi:predicted regulator of Ras-like GTPase activity (Roadblock/LC7/MglB family)